MVQLLGKTISLWSPLFLGQTEKDMGKCDGQLHVSIWLISNPSYMMYKFETSEYNSSLYSWHPAHCLTRSRDWTKTCPNKSMGVCNLKCSEIPNLGFPVDQEKLCGGSSLWAPSEGNSSQWKTMHPFIGTFSTYTFLFLSLQGDTANISASLNGLLSSHW
jgi:hypothetical protein